MLLVLLFNVLFFESCFGRHLSSRSFGGRRSYSRRGKSSRSYSTYKRPQGLAGKSPYSKKLLTNFSMNAIGSAKYKREISTSDSDYHTMSEYLKECKKKQLSKSEKIHLFKLSLFVLIGTMIMLKCLSISRLKNPEDDYTPNPTFVKMGMNYLKN